MAYFTKNEKIIKVYHSHIEITPYKLGECRSLEKMLSVYIEAEHKYEPLGYHYEEFSRTLYVPRGIELAMLQNTFNAEPIIIREYTKADRLGKDIHMCTPPRDRIQNKSIDFLSGKNEFVQGKKYAQQALILDTGDGKTYAAVHAILNLHMKACIITHIDDIKKQWIQTFIDRTNVPLNGLIDVAGSETMMKVINGDIEGDIYFVNHQTLNSFAKSHGWLAVAEFFKVTRVGIKIFDEAHKNFKNVMRVDFFSNVYKTFYLTANFDRTDTQEARLYRRAFSNVIKFGEETKNYEEKRKHIIYVPVLYQSNPRTIDLTRVVNAYGFSVLNFSKYALYDDPEKTQLRHFDYVFDIASRLEGRILITVPKIADTHFIMEHIQKEHPYMERSIGTINSKNDKDTNKYTKEVCDIICSTIKSCGTGTDIKRLRCVINLEPFSSHITANQLAGRLREYAPDKDTYFFDLVDTAFRSCENQYRSKLSHLRKKCKEVQVMRR